MLLREVPRVNGLTTIRPRRQPLWIRGGNPDLFGAGISQHSVAIPASAEGSWTAPHIDIPSLKGAGPKRKLDFLAGRYCALKALESLGLQDADSHELGIGANRAPLWPKGWVGSITHTGGFASAAVARTDLVLNLGLDSERLMDAQTLADVVPLALHPCEKELWRKRLQSSLGFECFVTLLFSAKESIFKCLNPLVGEFFDFHDVEILQIDLEAQAFSAKLLRPLSPAFPEGRVIAGRFDISLPYIHTAVELRHE